MACVWHLVKVIEDSHCNWADEYYHGACTSPILTDEVGAEVQGLRPQLESTTRFQSLIVKRT